MKWYLAVLKKYVVFSGRASRSEYWYFVLFNIIISVILTTIDLTLLSSGSADATLSGDAGTSMSMNMGILNGIYSLAIFLPALAVTIRRLHDTDRSGWWFLIAFVPVIGAIVLLIFSVQDSTAGDNRFGPSPKGLEP